MKKLLSVLATALVALAVLSGCSKNNGKVKIGVLQLVQHDALDANYQGFVDGLAKEGFVDGDNIVIDYQNASGDQSNCVTIAQKFVSDGVDLIFAIATPAAQAVANLTTTIPVVVSSVTDPESANLVKSNAMPGTNVTGTSDLTPCAAQISLLKQLLPEAKTVGMLFCSSEENSRFQINLAEAECKRLGLSYVEATVSNTNEVQQVVQSLVGKVDAIYSPTDNMIASSMATVAMVANENRIPVIVGEEGMVKNGGLATFGLNYYELGKQTAVMAAQILRDKADPATMPIQYLTSCDFSYNPDTAAVLGVEIPAELR